MQIAAATTANPVSGTPHDHLAGEPGSATAAAADPRFAQYKVIRRNGRVMVICDNPRHKQRQG